MAILSRTSIMVAAARAVGARESDPTVRNPDWLAERLIGPGELELIQEHPVSKAFGEMQEPAQDFQVAGTAMMMIVRTRYIDEKLERAVRNGATQAVILGAGLDTRAYRFQDLLEGKKVFEVDTPTTQEYKKRRLEEVCGPAPANLAYVPVDFNTGNLGNVLRQAGFRHSEKTFFVWEGVCMYVGEQGVRETLRSVAECAPGSSLVMDYAAKPVIDLVPERADLPQFKYLQNWQEPWVFGVPEGAEESFFQELGLEPVESLPVFGPEAIKRYLKRKDGTIAILPRGEFQLPVGSGTATGTATGGNVSWYSLVEL
ncbi:MAG: class I SAM-dependent methyltransferase, partial [Terriglobia bacterium]